jgi:hypothetical protein
VLGDSVGGKTMSVCNLEGLRWMLVAAGEAVLI